MRVWKKTPEQAEQRRQYYQLRYAPIAKAHADERAKREPVRARAKVMRSSLCAAANLGVPADLSALTTTYIYEWLLRQPACPCCGVTFRTGIRLGTGQKCDASPSIDRFIPSRGYVLGNVSLICWRCNNLKRDATADELARVAEWMRRRSIELATFGNELPAESPAKEVA
jgi:hypothetical protein